MTGIIKCLSCLWLGRLLKKSKAKAMLFGLILFMPVNSHAITPGPEWTCQWPGHPKAMGSAPWPLPPENDPIYNNWPSYFPYDDMETCKSALIAYSAGWVGNNPVLGWMESTVLTAHYYSQAEELSQYLNRFNFVGWASVDEVCAEECVIFDPPSAEIVLDNQCGAVSGTISVSSANRYLESATVTTTFPDGVVGQRTVTVGGIVDPIKEVTLTLPDGSTRTVNSFINPNSFGLTFADFGLPSSYQLKGQSGTFTVTATSAYSGKTVTASASVSADQGGLNVTVVPAKTTIESTLPDRDGFAPQNGKNETSVTVTVLDQKSAPANGANVTLSIERASTRYGGHDHDAATIADSARPKGTLKVPSGSTDTNGVFSSTYVASEFAAEDKIKAMATYQGCTGEAVSDPIASKLQWLSLLTMSPRSIAIGGTNDHFGPNDKSAPTSPDNNHWVTLDTNSKMGYLMEIYELSNHAGLQVNDASLPFGGLFDWKATWAPPHSTHRRGIDIDMRLLDTANQQAYPNIREIQRSNPDLYRSADIHDNNHIHVSF